MLRARLWPLLAGLVFAPPGGGRGRSSPRPRARRPPRGTSCVLAGTVSPRLGRWDVPGQRLSVRCIGSHYETRLLKREQARLYPLRTIQSGVRLCRRPCKPLGPFLSFLPKINPFIAVGAVELWAIAACPSALWSIRSIVHQARQIHSPTILPARGTASPLYTFLYIQHDI